MHVCALIRLGQGSMMGNSFPPQTRQTPAVEAGVCEPERTIMGPDRQYR